MHLNPTPTPPPPPATREPAGRPAGRARVGPWAWFILKNVVGWVFILAAMPVGVSLPGPGGLPLFLIGFGLITFPGKRRVTARVLRGTPVSAQSRAFRLTTAIVALTLPLAALLYVALLLRLRHRAAHPSGLLLGGIYAGAAILLLVVGLRSAPAVNWLLGLMPKMRRRVRPWMRRHGIDLLPPRRRRRSTGSGRTTREPDEEILELSTTHLARVHTAWSAAQVWLRRAAAVGITVALFVWILRPVVRHWDQVKDRIWEMRWGQVFAASVMFAAFLFFGRALAWRRILIGFGHRLPVAAATRIWSTSELARYLPGVIWQVVGRVYLIRPYGVSGSVCSASQVLELVIFLLANVLLAVSCLVWLGIKSFHGPAQVWLWGVMALIPVLLVLVHPRIFYGITNRVMARVGKPLVSNQLSFRQLVELLLWAVLGLLWQSLAIWLVVSQPLGLQFTKWWVVAGAYSLAWCAGFLAVWAPGGLGVRELVFIAAVDVALPAPVRRHFEDPKVLLGFLAFLSVLLRLWATTGELLLAGIAYLWDYQGAIGRPAAANAVRDAKRAIRLD